MHCLTFANYKAVAHIAFITWHLMAVIPRARSFIGTTGQKGQACLEAAAFLLTATKHVTLFGLYFWIAVVIFYYVKTRAFL